MRWAAEKTLSCLRVLVALIVLRSAMDCPGSCPGSLSLFLMSFGSGCPSNSVIIIDYRTCYPDQFRHLSSTSLVPHLCCESPTASGQKLCTPLGMLVALGHFWQPFLPFLKGYELLGLPPTNQFSLYSLSSQSNPTKLRPNMIMHAYQLRGPCLC